MATVAAEAVAPVPVVAHRPWWRGKLVQVADPKVRHLDPHLGRIDVEQGCHAEPAFGEPLVPSQRLPEVPDPGDQDRPVLGETERGTDLVDQVGDVVADPAGPVRTQCGKILAHLSVQRAERLVQ